MDFGRGPEKLNIDLDEDTSKEKCVKHPHGYPATKENGEDVCVIVYKGNGEKLDEDVEIENISQGKVTLVNKETGEEEKYEI